MTTRARHRQPAAIMKSLSASTTTRLLLAVLFLAILLLLLIVVPMHQPSKKFAIVSAFTSTTTKSNKFNNNLQQQPSSSSPLLFVVKDENQQQQKQRQQKQQERRNEQNEEEEEDDIQSSRLEIRKWSQIKAPHGPKEAEKVLRKMIQLYSSNNEDNANDENSSTSQQPINKEEGEEGQGQGQDQQQRNNKNIKKNSYSRPYVDVIDCNQVINAYSKSRNDDNAPQYALQILKDMSKSGTYLVPNVVTYNSVINGYAQKGNFVGASKVFQLQINDYKQNNNTDAKPNVRSFNTMINACSKHITLNARNKSNNKDFSSGGDETNSNNDNDNDNSMPEIAEKLLATLEEWYTMGEIDNGADTITYSAVINCWSKSDTIDGPQRALDLLNKMISQNIEPNTITYNSVLDAYARQGNIIGANNVFQMMQQQQQQQQQNGGGDNSSCRPNVRSYNILIDAWSKSINNNNSNNNSNNDCDAPEEAESLLKQMILLHSKGELEDFPDTITYNGVINCWGKSNNSIQSAKHCLDILKKMILKYESDKIKYKRLRVSFTKSSQVKSIHSFIHSNTSCSKSFVVRSFVRSV
jgi:pentatricopeptide repeat protein